jgi:hypothetical protein
LLYSASDADIKTILEYFNITKLGNFEDDFNNPYLNGAKVPDNLPAMR